MNNSTPNTYIDYFDSQKTLFVYNLEIKLRSAVAAERRASINVRTAKKD